MKLFTARARSIKASFGFTLIELLVVIAIIGLLAGIVLASLDSARKKGRDAKRVSDVKQLIIALELYYDSNNSYPLALSTANLGSYLSVIPTDPSQSGACTSGAEVSCYKYAPLTSGTSCSSYHIGAVLEVTNNSALSTDNDAAAGTACASTVNNTSNADFAGTDPIYDKKP